MRFYNGEKKFTFDRGSFGKSGGKSAPTKGELQDGTIKWLQENEPSYLQNELQTLFDEKGWILIYTPQGSQNGSPLKPFGEWQRIMYGRIIIMLTRLIQK